MAPPGPAAKDQVRQQWWLEPVVCRRLSAGSSYRFLCGRGQVQTHMEGSMQTAEPGSITCLLADAASLPVSVFSCDCIVFPQAWALQWRPVVGSGQGGVGIQVKGLAANEYSCSGQWHKTGPDPSPKAPALVISLLYCDWTFSLQVEGRILPPPVPWRPAKGIRMASWSV